MIFLGLINGNLKPNVFAAPFRVVHAPIFALPDLQ